MSVDRADQRTLKPDAVTLGQLLDVFFGGPDAPGALNWPQALQEEHLLLRISGWGSHDARLESVTYVADDVTQIAPPRPYDPLRCAASFTNAISKERR